MRFFTGFCRRFPRLARFMGFMRRRRRPLRALVMIFAHSLGFVFSIQAVMQTRTEQGAIAWAFSSLTIWAPVGFPAISLERWSGKE